MQRPVIIAAVTLTALGVSAEAPAAVTASGLATLQIQPAASINVTNLLSLPTLSTVGLTPVSGALRLTGVSGTAVSVAPGGAGNAALTISGQSGEAVSMAVPESFRVIRTGGTEALTVKTNTNVEYNLAPDSVIVGGFGAETMSVNVGGALNFASSDRPEPGAYRGLLVVVVQYN
jgi:hypothetical protein